MKKNILAILTLLIPFLVLARPSSREIEMQDLKAIKSTKRLVLTSPSGSQTIEVKGCNQKAVNQYWSELSKNSKAAKSPKRIKTLLAESRKLCKNS